MSSAISYPDCEATSPNGKYTLEARCPHNGTINLRDGRPPSEYEFAFKYREHQSEFRDRLIDKSRTSLLARLFGKDSGSVLWEKWQKRGENSPAGLVVSDDGWSILRTHGFNPELIAVSPEGKDVIQVRIAGPKDEDVGEEDAEEAETETRPQRGNTHLWRAARLVSSRTGISWTWDSWPYFFSLNKVNYFAWRTAWGQRLVIDLTNAALLSEEEQGGASFSHAMREAETQGACSFLSDLAGQATEIQRLLAPRRQDSDAETQNLLHLPLWKLVQATPAIHLAGVHRATTCIPLLRRLEEIDFPRYKTSSTAMGYGWMVEPQCFRPILHHTLRLLGEEPQGYAAYHFTNEAGRFPVAERVSGRRERAATLNLSMDAEQVLRLLGSPDHVRQESHKAGDRCRWTEDWEYDFHVDERWVSLRITWEEDNRKGRIARFEEVPSPWLHSDQREDDLLHF
jgi:hypothetical protein